MDIEFTRIERSALSSEITRLYEEGDYDGIGNLEGVTIFEKRDHEQDTRVKFGCVTWIFGGNREKVISFTSNAYSPPGYEEVVKPKEGDIVNYYFRLARSYQPEPTHTGIYLGNGRVRSKFRESHVYDHPLEAVPEGYGSEVKFFREKKD